MHRLRMPVACVVLALGWPYAPVADAGCLRDVGLGVAWLHRLRMPVACVVLALGWPYAPVADAGCLRDVGLGVAWCTGCGCRLLVCCWPWGGLVHRRRMPVACVNFRLEMAWFTGCGCR